MNMDITYRICSNCVMDTSDPDITFDAAGVCNHCLAYDEQIRTRTISGEAGRRHAEKLAAEIRRAGAGQKYDCLIGVSGGVDSSFVAYKVKELGLRPLAVHLDNGWDSELAVKNIENLLNILEIDLYTEVLDWEEFKDLQLAFLKASTPDSEIPTDHAVFATLYKIARKMGIKYVLSGVNTRTETHLPSSWSQGHFDWRYIKSVHAQFGTGKLRTFPHLTFFQGRRFAAALVDILNYLDYVKRDAMRVLQEELGWKYYGGKHYESIYTRFYQGYMLPTKFGYDKRRSHLSSLVCSGEIGREEALRELENETYPLDMQRADREYVVKKLGVTDAELESIMAAPKKSFWDYPSHSSFTRTKPYLALRKIYRVLKGRANAGIPGGVDREQTSRPRGGTG